MLNLQHKEVHRGSQKQTKPPAKGDTKGFTEKNLQHKEVQRGSQKQARYAPNNIYYACNYILI